MFGRWDCFGFIKGLGLFDFEIVRWRLWFWFVCFGFVFRFLMDIRLWIRFYVGLGIRYELVWVSLGLIWLFLCWLVRLFCWIYGRDAEVGGRIFFGGVGVGEGIGVGLDFGFSMLILGLVSRVELLWCFWLRVCCWKCKLYPHTVKN